MLFKKEKAKVILDTNFLLIPAQFHVNIFTEIERIMENSYDLCIVKGTIEELNKLVVMGKGKDSVAAKLASALVGSLIKQKSLKTLTNSQKSYVDDAIVSYANDKVFIATQDKELKKRAKAKGSKIITLKQKKYLGFE